MLKGRKKEILACLEETYGGMETALHYESPFELLVAVILSAQCTDERVNKITARIFPRYASPQKMAGLTQEQMEEMIRDCGLFRAKAKNILSTCQRLLENFNGEVPSSIEDLMTLPGVGKKTANVIASVVFNVPAIAVDTHVFRVSHRLALSCGKDPLAVEKDLMKTIPREKWGEAHHWLIWHGRKLCKARKPLCPDCPLAELCTYEDKQ
ncbi:MAG: endonuclease III [Acidaminococcaceae bacterium]|nr:endonuclease III [Acidaminococcaceae bacterium]